MLLQQASVLQRELLADAVSQVTRDCERGGKNIHLCERIRGDSGHAHCPDEQPRTRAWCARGVSHPPELANPCGSRRAHCEGVLLDGRPCGPTGASPGFSLRQQPLTMSPCGKLTCAEYGNVSLRSGSVQEAFWMVADSAYPPFIGARPFFRCHAQTFWSGTQKNPPR